MQLRGYQKEAVDAVIQAFKDRKRPLVELPTGSGKTVVFAELARRLKSGRALVLVHRKELKAQAKEKLRTVIGGVVWDVDVKMVQALASWIKRRSKYQTGKDEYSLIIIDEAHHATASTYQRILDHYNCNCVVGFTATAYREQGGTYTEEALIGDDGPFDEIVYQRSISEMIDEGYLVKPRAIRIETHTNLTGTKTVAGDYAPGALDAVINNEARNQLVVDKWEEYAGQQWSEYGLERKLRKTIIFCITVDHALAVANAFKERERTEPLDALVAGTAECVYGAMPKDQRESIIEGFKGNGTTDILTTVGVLTEGFDAPATACIIMARPTKSPILFTQCIGRGLRPSDGKTECLVLDFADVAGKHRLDDVHIGDVMPGAEESREKKGSNIDDPDRLEPMPPPEEIIKETTAKEVQLLDPNRAPSHGLQAFLSKHGQWIEGLTHFEANKINRRLRAQGCK